MLDRKSIISRKYTVFNNKKIPLFIRNQIFCCTNDSFYSNLSLIYGILTINFMGYIMNYTITETDNVLNVTLTGSSDMAGLKKFSETVNTLSSECTKDVEIDMEQVEYVDSSFISLLLKLHKSQQQKSLGFRITKASDRVTSVLNLCSLSGTLHL